MDNKLDDLEASLEQTGGKLENIALKLNEFDEQMTGALLEDTNCKAVESLLQSVKQVQTEYLTFRKNLSEVKELQRQVHDALHVNANDLQKRFEALRTRMIAHQVHPSKTHDHSNA